MTGKPEGFTTNQLINQTLLWKEIVKLSLLGTERSSLSSSMKAALKNYGIDTDKEITEVVLESAALLAPLQKAGFQPKKWTGKLLVKSPDETLTNCSTKSANHLHLIISGRYPFALEEFVEKMVHHQKCLPFELLPELLDKCIKEEQLWQKLQPTIGNRGNWLINLNPAWQVLNIIPIAIGTTEKWVTGTKRERINILKKLRQQTPKKGLEFLLTTWTEDGLSEKTAFLKCLNISLSDFDEAFLEECLDFPRKEIRGNAALLLSQLPNSQLQKRIYEQLKTAISVGKNKPIIVLPNPKDIALIRDGINPKKKWKKSGETTGMLYQMVAILPPEKWERHLQKTPNQILNFFGKSEWSMMLVEGIAKAAALHRSKPWIEAILRFWLNNFSNRHWTQLDVKPIFGLIPMDVFNQVLYEKLKASPFLPDEHSPLIQLLQKDSYVWEDRLTNTVMNQLKEWIKNNVSYSWTGFQYRTMLKRAAYAINPKMEKQLSHFWLGDSTAWAGWDKDIHQFLDVLRFRKDMLVEISKKTDARPSR